MNPASLVRGPKYVIKHGKTPVLCADEARTVLESIPPDTGIEAPIGCHTWRGTGITDYLENGGTLENAAAIAAHESPRTTKLYDRADDEITLDEVERIAI